MDPSPSTPVPLVERRLAWLDARQRVLAQNIANADTPGYRPRDVTDFRRLVASQDGPRFGLARTDPRHLATQHDPRTRVDRVSNETEPNGNAVSLDREALKVADTDTAHALALQLHRSWLGMFRTALGRA